ncbi:MAG: hypothetical protein UT63_C0069G0010, partial [Candidatus Gottesmanbacteria bacterium GW2011_GWC2_39_8]
MNVYSQVQSNRTRTYIIMALFMVFIATVAYIFGQGSGEGLSWAGLALIVSGLMNLGSYWWGD